MDYTVGIYLAVRIVKLFFREAVVVCIPTKYLIKFQGLPLKIFLTILVVV